MTSFAITCCFQKVNFQACNLVTLNCELPSAFLYPLCELLQKNRLFYGEIKEFEKIMDSLTNFAFTF